MFAVRRYKFTGREHKFTGREHKNLLIKTIFSPGTFLKKTLMEVKKNHLCVFILTQKAVPLQKD